MSKITKETTLFETMKGRAAAAKVLASYHMGCQSCSGARFETVEWGARMHGVDVKELLKKLNEAASKN